jgi:hypothetical protein
LQLSASGSGEVYEDNDRIISDLIDAEFGGSDSPSGGGDDPGMNPTMNPTMNPGGGDPMSMPTLGAMGSSGGCALGPVSESRSGSAAACLLGLLALGAMRRRRG